MPPSLVDLISQHGRPYEHGRPLEYFFLGGQNLAGWGPHPGNS